MIKHRFFWILSLIVLTSGAYRVSGDEPPEPLPPGSDPYDWECVYAFSEMNCKKVVQLWAEDHLEDVSDLKFEMVVCDGCTPKTVTDSQGTEWITGYRCENPHGYAVDVAQLDSVMQLYRETGSQDGWRVTDWAMHRCLQTWDCFDDCAWNREFPACLLIRVVSIGRFQPILGDPCSRPAADPKQDSGGGSESIAFPSQSTEDASSTDATGSSGQWY